MRYYRFVVGGQLFELSSSNPNEVRIVFDITSVDDVEYSRPAIISLYNVSSTFFTLAKQFKNTPMILQAGIKNVGLARRLNFDMPLNDILFMGLVDDVLTAWEGKETVVHFLGRTLPSLNYPVDSMYYVASIKAGQPISQAVGLIISKYLIEMRKPTTITIDPSTLSITSKQKQDLPIRPPKNYISGLRYFSKFLKSFGLVLSQDGENLTITTLEVLTRTTLAGVAMISKTSLLSQPVYENNETISLQVALDGKYQLGQYVMLPPDIPLATGSIISEGGLIQRAQGDTGFLIMQGVFLTKEVHHIGDSRNIDAMAWATNMLCVRQIGVKK